MGLKIVQAKLNLLNSALYITYELKLKITNKKSSYYHLVSPFNSSNASKLPLYQTGEEIYWKNEKISDMLIVSSLLMNYY